MPSRIGRALLGAGAASLGAVAATLIGPASAVPAASAAAPVLSATATPAELTLGATLTVSGTLLQAGEALPSATVSLQADSYPFRGYATIARQRTAADGSFSFAGMRPDRNTRLRVVLEGAGAAVPAAEPALSSGQLTVIVDPRVAINARRLGPGATRLSIRIRHTPLGGSAPVPTRWFLAARGSHDFRLAAETSSRELSAGVTYASATIDPPSRRFAYRVCLNPGWEGAMGPPASHRPCPAHELSERGGTIPAAFQGEGTGTPVAAYPSSGAIAARRRATSTARAGSTSLAVLDSAGRAERGAPARALRDRERGQGDDARGLPADAQRRAPRPRRSRHARCCIR